MPTNLDKYRSALESLVTLGNRMAADLHFRYLKKEGRLSQTQQQSAKEIAGTFEREYQPWYSEAMAVIRQLTPDRLQEFLDLYKPARHQKTLDADSYGIQDWLKGVRASVHRTTHEKSFDDLVIASNHFSTQLQILGAAARRFESSLFDIRQVVQADLFDSELDRARELAKSGFLRAAGVIAGVVLEKHLCQVAANHNLVVRKKNPTIADLNDLLKNNSVIDIPAWRQTQRLGDIRNLCGHSREREPTPEEVEELISGVDRVTKTLL